VEICKFSRENLGLTSKDRNRLAIAENNGLTRILHSAKAASVQFAHERITSNDAFNIAGLAPHNTALCGSARRKYALKPKIAA